MWVGDHKNFFTALTAMLFLSAGIQWDHDLAFLLQIIAGYLIGGVALRADRKEPYP